MYCGHNIDIAKLTLFACPPWTKDEVNLTAGATVVEALLRSKKGEGYLDYGDE